MLEQKPFTRYHLEKKVDSFTIRLNAEERTQLEEDKRILEQVKDSTAMKQLAKIGSIVIHDPKMKLIFSTVFKNKRCNRRLGIDEF